MRSSLDGEHLSICFHPICDRRFNYSLCRRKSIGSYHSNNASTCGPTYQFRFVLDFYEVSRRLGCIFADRLASRYGVALLWEREKAQICINIYLPTSAQYRISLCGTGAPPHLRFPMNALFAEQKTRSDRCQKANLNSPFREQSHRFLVPKKGFRERQLRLLTAIGGDGSSITHNHRRTIRS